MSDAAVRGWRPGAPPRGAESGRRRRLAARLRLRQGLRRTAAHAVTLVGRDGALDLVLEGRPRDAPRLAGLTPEAVEAVLRSGMLIR